jgi:hypothetical protein
VVAAGAGGGEGVVAAGAGEGVVAAGAGAGGDVVAAGAEGGAATGGRRRRRTTKAMRVAAGALTLAVLAHAAGGRSSGVIDGEALGAGATVWRAGATVLVVDGRARAGAVLEGLRDRRVARIDLVVVRTGAAGTIGIVAALRRRAPGVIVLGPQGYGQGGSSGRRGPADVSTPPAGAVIEIGRMRLTVTEASPERLDVEVELMAGTGARAPPGPTGRPRSPAR